MEAQPFLLPLCSGGRTIGLLPYRTPWLGLGKLAATGLCFGFLCYLPVIYNRFRFWLFFRWPNKRLHRRIASLEAQMNHQSASGGQGA
jgi:hypothetical protein